VAFVVAYAGQTGATLHEGLSLVECLVPVLRVMAL
jgi:hypothetical protein